MLYQHSSSIPAAMRKAAVLDAACMAKAAAAHRVACVRPHADIHTSHPLPLPLLKLLPFICHLCECGRFCCLPRNMMLRLYFRYLATRLWAQC